jgi:Zn-dependent M28 family amino/carboxypeptidase
MKLALALVFLAALAAWLAARAITSMPGERHRGAPAPASGAERDLARRLRAHVSAVASEEHNVAHPHALERSARYIEGALAAPGYRVARDEFEAGGVAVRNLEVVVPGAKADARDVLVVGAHYDSVLGATGANDNGSGVAALIELARALRGFRAPDGIEIRLVAYVNEEMPWFGTEAMGSLRHARALAAAGKRVIAMLSLETIGCYSDAPGSQRYPAPFSALYPGEGNFIGFVGNWRSRALVRRAVASFRAHAAFPSEGGAFPDFVKDAGRSDHWAYWQQGWPGLMVTDTAPFRYPQYHTLADTPDKIDYERMARVVLGVEAVIRDLAASPAD